MGLTAGISLKDWAFTGASAGFLYMWGYRYSEWRGQEAPASASAMAMGGCPAPHPLLTALNLIALRPHHIPHHHHVPADSPIFKLTGHRLGALIAAPTLLLGWGSGLHRSYLRHVGLLPNGMPSIYPGYVEDETPYIVKHRVSDRRGELPAMSTPGLAFDGAGKEAYLASLGGGKAQ